MGLKTNNYVSKRLNITLPEAYAKLTELTLQKDNQARAIFSIQSSREDIKTLAPIDKVEVNFVWDRKADICKMAYEVAKTDIKVYEVFNKETGEMETKSISSILFGWNNDFINEV